MIMTKLMEMFEQALLSADRVAAREAFIQSAGDTSSIEAVDSMIVPALERIGSGWENGNVSLSQVYMSARICEELSESLPGSSNIKNKNLPRIAVALLEDYHVLGKKIVCSVLKAGGIEFIDYHRASIRQLINRVNREKIEILLVSVLMLNSALKIKDLKNEFLEKGIGTKIIAGGAPFRLDENLWQEVGADAAGRSASDALSLVHNFVTDIK